jgi:anti-sigma factor RsiW
MQCIEAHEVLGAVIDGEVAFGDQVAARAHIASCPACAAVATDYRAIGDRLRATAYQPLPAGLADTIRARIAAEPTAANDNKRPIWRSLMSQAAMLVIVSGLSGLLGWHFARTALDEDRTSRDVVAAHVRALIQDSPVQIASSQSHTVKPWFNGRVDFAPAVKDLTAEGFPLVGGRLDVVGNRRIAALVYKRRLHVIGVFIWPADQPTRTKPKMSSQQGFNIITWTSGDLTYWAVSDLNPQELAQLQNLL